MNRALRAFWLRSRRVLHNETLNKPLATALIPPLMLALLGGWFLPQILQHNTLRNEALRQRGDLELAAVRELHALTRDFLKVRLEYDFHARLCSSPSSREVCLADRVAAIAEFARQWDEGAGYSAVVLTAYLEHPEESQEMTHLANLREIVDKKINCLFLPDTHQLNTTTCELTERDIGQLEVELACFSRLLLENARRHSEGRSSRGPSSFWTWGSAGSPVDCD